MYYYPQFFPDKNLINLMLVFPGGWGLDIDKKTAPHFLLEPLLFAPTPDFADPDAWLWEHTVDFWSITSFESIRINITLTPEKLATITPLLEKLVQPREIETSFLEKEINNLKHFWTTQRQREEDEDLLKLLPGQNVVHPKTNCVDQLSLKDQGAVQKIWKDLKPHAILLGEAEADDVLSLAKIFPHRPDEGIVFPTRHAPPKNRQDFFGSDRLGWRFDLPVSHWQELLIIELWEKVFNVDFFFEYHGSKLFVWTQKLEYPKLLQQKMTQYVPSSADFEEMKKGYGEYLNLIKSTPNRQTVERLAELVEGFHPHPYQATTFPKILPKPDLKPLLEKLEFADFQVFYQGFWRP